MATPRLVVKMVALGQKVTFKPEKVAKQRNIASEREKFTEKSAPNPQSALFVGHVHQDRRADQEIFAVKLENFARRAKKIGRTIHS